MGNKNTISPTNGHQWHTTQAATAWQINKQLAGLFEVKAEDNLGIGSLFLAVSPFNSQFHNGKAGYKLNDFILNYILNSQGEFALSL